MDYLEHNKAQAHKFAIATQHFSQSIIAGEDPGLSKFTKRDLRVAATPISDSSSSNTASMSSSQDTPSDIERRKESKKRRDQETPSEKARRKKSNSREEDARQTRSATQRITNKRRKYDQRAKDFPKRMALTPEREGWGEDMPGVWEQLHDLAKTKLGYPTLSPIREGIKKLKTRKNRPYKIIDKKHKKHKNGEKKKQHKKKHKKKHNKKDLTKKF